MFNRVRSFFLENTSMKQTVVKNTAWLGGSMVISRIIKAVMILYAARALGTAGYGVFSYAISVAAFFAIFADIGLTGLLTREAAKKPEKLSEYVSTIAVFKLILVSATALAIIFIAPFFIKIDEAKILLPIVALIVLLDNLRSFSFSISRAHHRMEIEGVLDMLTELLITGLGFAVLFLWPTTYNLAIAYALGGAVGLLVIFIAIRRQFTFSLKHFNRSLIRPIFSASWPFALLAVFSTFMTNIDTIILGWYRNAHELGLFAAAFRPITILYLIPGFLNSSLAPLLSQLVERKEFDTLRTILGKTIAMMAGLALPFMMGGIILASSLISLLFGGAYSESVLTFQILLITVLAVFPGMIIGTTAYAMDLQKLFIRASAIGAIANIGLDLLLIPAYGIVGSAIATVVAQFLMNGYNAWHIKKILGYTVLPRIYNILIATTVMSLVIVLLYSLHLYVLYIVAIGAVVYVGTLLLLREKLIKDMVSIFSREHHTTV